MIKMINFDLKSNAGKFTFCKKEKRKNWKHSAFETLEEAKVESYKLYGEEVNFGLIVDKGLLGMCVEDVRFK